MFTLLLSAVFTLIFESPIFKIEKIVFNRGGIFRNQVLKPINKQLYFRCTEKDKRCSFQGEIQKYQCSLKFRLIYIHKHA